MNMPSRQDLQDAINAPPVRRIPPKHAIPAMQDHELSALYSGKNVQKKGMAATELEKRYPGITKALDVQHAAARVDTTPTDPQKDAGNYKKGHITLHGLNITIENPKGSARTGTDHTGKPWSVTMPAHYGYIKRTTGADGDHVDVFIGPDHASDKVFVIDQADAHSGKWDEHKCFIAFPNIQSAVDAYDKSFSDGKAEARIGAVTIMTIKEFKDWLKTGKTKKPLTYKAGK